MEHPKLNDSLSFVDATQAEPRVLKPPFESLVARLHHLQTSIR